MAGSFGLSCSGSPGAAVVLKETLESSSTHGCLPGCTRNQPASLSTRHPFSLALRRRSCARSSGHGWSSWSLARRDQSSLPWRLTKLASDYDTWTCQEAINHISNDAEMPKFRSISTVTFRWYLWAKPSRFPPSPIVMWTAPQGSSLPL